MCNELKPKYLLNIFYIEKKKSEKLVHFYISTNKIYIYHNGQENNCLTISNINFK